MSAHIPCTCEGTRKERIKNWVVTQRNCNYSHFESPKGAKHYSEYSTIRCKNCGMNIRSKADYVYSLPTNEDYNYLKERFDANNY